MTEKAEKPEGIPRYFTTRGIVPSPDSDWQYDQTQNVWVWKSSPQEVAQFEEAEKEYAMTFTKVGIRQEDYGVIKLDGVTKTVWQDEEGKDYITNYETEERMYLKDNWWQNPEIRADANKGIDYVEKLTFTPRSNFWGGLSDVKLPKVSLPEVKLPEVKLPGADLGLSTATKGIATIVLIFVAIIVGLVALGYSGLGGSVGRVSEKEYARKRK